MIAIDEAHIQLIKALVMSHKPTAVLEVGLGTGLTSSAILDAIEFNGMGRLTIVDNLYDFHGTEPYYAESLRSRGAEIIIADEQGVVVGAEGKSYDFIVSDADHHHAHEWFDHYIRIARDGAVLIFHDTANDEYANLKEIKRKARSLSLSHVEFATSSRSDEQCERGLLVIFHKEGR